MIDIKEFISDVPSFLQTEAYRLPWRVVADLEVIIKRMLPHLGPDYTVENGIAIHKTATIEKGVTLKSPVIIAEKCQVGAHAYFREGVFLDSSVKIGPSSEIKSSLIFSSTAIAHLNYIGNSIIGSNVNFEAGSIAANHYNEREDKRILVRFKNELVDTGLEKFGALVGDGSKIGANAVLSPGTILPKGAIVKRLELVEQVKVKNGNT